MEDQRKKGIILSPLKKVIFLFGFFIILSLAVLFCIICLSRSRLKSPTEKFIQAIESNNQASASRILKWRHKALVKNSSPIVYTFEKYLDKYNQTDAEDSEVILNLICSLLYNDNDFKNIIDFSCYYNLKESKEHYRFGLKEYDESTEDVSYEAFRDMCYVIDKDSHYDDAKRIAFEYIDSKNEHMLNKIQKNYEKLCSKVSTYDNSKVSELKRILDADELAIKANQDNQMFLIFELKNTNCEEYFNEREDVHAVYHDVCELNETYLQQRLVLVEKLENNLKEGNIANEHQNTTVPKDNPIEYYLADNLPDGLFIIEDDKFYPFEISPQKQVVQSGYNDFFIRVTDMKNIDKLVPKLSKNTIFAYRGSTDHMEDSLSVKQIRYTSYTYDLLTRGNMRLTYKFTPKGYEFNDFAFLDGKDIDFYDYSEEHGYDRVAASSVTDNGVKIYAKDDIGGNSGDLLISPDITPETPLTVGYYDKGTDYKEQTIYPTIFYLTTSRKDGEYSSYSEDIIDDILECERTKDGYFKYTFPEGITSGYYILHQGSFDGGDLLIYIED